MKPPKKPPADPPEPDDEEDVNDALDPEKVNKAITSHLKRFMKQLDAKFETLLAPYSERFEKLEAAISAGPADDKDREKSKEAENAALAKLKKELDAEKAARLDMEKRAADEREKARASQREHMVISSLAKAGITNPTVAKAAASLLLPAVDHAEDGRVVYKRQNKFGLDEEIDVESAIGEWTKSEDGKAFLPAKPVKGAGGQVPNQRQMQSPPSGKLDPKADKATRVEAARDFLRTAFAPFTGQQNE
jgi:hypothetical protein